MPQPDHVHILPLPDVDSLDADMQKFFAICDDKLGLVPAVLQSWSFRQKRLRNFISLYNEIMLGESGLSKLEREMIAVVVSSCNSCYYCLVAHGQAVRQLSGDPQLGEMLVMNYRVAELDKRQRAMLDFAWKLTEEPKKTTQADRQAVLDAGFGEEEYWDICETISLYNYTNRMAHGVDMMPNAEYHTKDRG